MYLLIVLIVSSNRTYSYCYENWVGEGIDGPVGRSLYTVILWLVMFMMRSMRRRMLVLVMLKGGWMMIVNQMWRNEEKPF